MAELVPQPEGADTPGDPASPSISDPAELIRIAGMVGAMLQEARELSLDEPGRRRLAQVHRRALDEVKGLVSSDLQEELEGFAPPIIEEVPSESELQVAQAQLVGWLDGLVRGIQATIVTQQRAAQAQLQQLSQDQGGAPEGNSGRASPYL